MRDNRNTRILLAFLLVLSLTLVLIDARSRSIPGRGIAAAILGPLQSAASTITSPIGGFISDLVNLPRVRSQMDRLTAENDQLRSEIARSEYVRNRAAELDALLRIAGQGQYKVVAAQVVAIGPAQDYTRTVTIDAGKRDGIAPQMTVIAGRGLVGTVVSVGPSTATVALIADRNSRVGARNANTMEIGVVSGDGTLDSLSMQFLTSAEPRAGQRVVTRGSINGRPYVAGVPVGQIVSVDGGAGQLQTAVLRPYVDLGALDVVGVVVEPPRVDPRDAVLPTPLPTPTVTVTVTAPAAPAAVTPTPTPTTTKKR